jgi:hypothetical protein
MVLTHEMFWTTVLISDLINLTNDAKLVPFIQGCFKPVTVHLT